MNQYAHELIADHKPQTFNDTVAHSLVVYAYGKTYRDALVIARVLIEHELTTLAAVK